MPRLILGKDDSICRPLLQLQGGHHESLCRTVHKLIDVLKEQGKVELAADLAKNYDSPENFEVD